MGLFLKKTKGGILIILLILLFGVTGAQNTKIVFSGISDTPVSKFTVSELKKFITNDDLIEIENQGITGIYFSFLRDTLLPEAAFKIESQENGNSLNVFLSGNTESDILYAAYTFLEKGGYLFEITGPVIPEKFNWQAVNNYTEEIIPAVKKRGIRQHINFPMDLSAWSEKDAKEYIRNLARMRFNYITFHSYPGQWYEVHRKDTIEYAGNFFYGKNKRSFVDIFIDNGSRFCKFFVGKSPSFKRLHDEIDVLFFF